MATEREGTTDFIKTQPRLGVTDAKEIIEYMESLQDEAQRQNLMRLFKTGPGQYGEGDEIVTLYLQYAEQANNWDLVDLSLIKILGHWLLLPTFLGSDFCSKEFRNQGKVPTSFSKDSRIQGKIPIFQDSLDYKREVLDSLAAIPCLWKQRMSIVATWYPSHHGDPLWCLRYAEQHLHHPHDLMHKAVG